MIGKDFNIRLIKNAVTLYNNKELIDKFINFKNDIYIKEYRKGN